MKAEENIPAHVAIILDGNGRWAKQRNLSRPEGHRAGGDAVDRLFDDFIKYKIPYLSLYAFSTENWKRPKTEVLALWSLLEEFFKKRLQKCLDHDICIRTSGDISKLPSSARKVVEEAIEKTKNGKRLTANFCLNYGSQDEILHAVTLLLREKINSGEKVSEITKKEFEKFLYTYPLPPVDLLVRPGGEQRISNFLLWQCAYAELYFCETLWPDFNAAELEKALHWYQQRERRFGGIGADHE